MHPMPATTLPRLSRDAQRLLTLTEALTRSGSRLEDIYWEGLLAVQLNKILLAKKNKTVETALDHLLATDVNAYEILVEQAETLSESTSLTHEGVEYDALLFSAPLVAWTRYQLPQGELTAEQITALVTQMQASVVAPDAHLAIVPRLINFDQMPQTFQETRPEERRVGKECVSTCRTR